MECQHIQEFENSWFLHSLFADDPGLLKQAEDTLGLHLTTRDNWLRFDGPLPAVNRGRQLFERLENLRREGTTISPPTFRMTLESVVSGETSNPLDSVSNLKMLGSATKQAVMPRSRGQIEYLKALRQNVVVFGIGPAGTGKTYLAMAHAIHLLKNREVDRIVLTRPAVEAGEALGFLPGALEEKVLPYLRPLYDALYDMLEPGESQKFVEKNLIEIAPLAYMRGRTLNRACVILDEAQNATREQMFMLLTRIGEGSRCVVTGDPSQVDLRPASRSGLFEALDILGEIPGIHINRFAPRDVVRHPVVQSIIEAYDASRKSAAEAEKSGENPRSKTPRREMPPSA
ncbi:MAG: PhoH family protein [Verrucomicrobiales bacterium]|nr:PhoH family protein [Verrucomicrobiales bacterium]